MCVRGTKRDPNENLIRSLTKTDCYEIRVKGHLDSDWTDWFEGLTVTETDSDETILTGYFLDQSALHGLISYLQNKKLFLISVKHVGASDVIKKSRD